MRLGSRNSIHCVDMDDEEESEEETDDDGDDEQEEEDEEEEVEEIVGSEEVNGGDPQAGEEIVSHSVDDNNSIDQYHPANEGEEVVSADSSAEPVSRLALVSAAKKKWKRLLRLDLLLQTRPLLMRWKVSGNDDRASFESTSSKVTPMKSISKNHLLLMIEDVPSYPLMSSSLPE
jgi:hypothetical protein